MPSEEVFCLFIAFSHSCEPPLQFLTISLSPLASPASSPQMLEELHNPVLEVLWSSPAHQSRCCK